MNKNNLNHIHHVDIGTIKRMYSDYSPVFVLSTGRAGTKFISELLKKNDSIDSFHEPVPTLQYFSDFAFHNQNKKELLKNMINAARMEIILKSYIEERIYFESNQCITFFAYALKELFNKVKFIHLIRHPGDFVRSAIRKGWYKNDSIWEYGRVKHNSKTLWKEISHVEQLAWLWSSTNRFIEGFKKDIKDEQIYTLKFERLTEDISIIHKLTEFIGAGKMDDHLIELFQKDKVNSLKIFPNEPPNIQKKGFYPAYSDWDKERKDKLKSGMDNLPDLYGYTL